MLTEEQKNIYSKDGYVILPSVIPQNNLLAMVNDLNQWIEESKSQKNNYGETKNGKSRFDLEEGHSANNPKLRRVANPTDISVGLATRRSLGFSALCPFSKSNRALPFFVSP